MLINLYIIIISTCTTIILKIYRYFQKKLHTLTMESERLQSEISSRNELQKRIDSETQTVEEV